MSLRRWAELGVALSGTVESVHSGGVCDGLVFECGRFNEVFPILDFQVPGQSATSRCGIPALRDLWNASEAAASYVGPIAERCHSSCFLSLYRHIQRVLELVRKW